MPAGDNFKCSLISAWTATVYLNVKISEKLVPGSQVQVFDIECHSYPRFLIQHLEVVSNKNGLSLGFLLFSLCFFINLKVPHHKVGDVCSYKNLWFYLKSSVQLACYNCSWQSIFYDHCTQNASIGNMVDIILSTALIEGWDKIKKFNQCRLTPSVFIQEHSFPSFGWYEQLTFLHVNFATFH